MTDNNPIMGIKTKACINGVYPDTIPNIQQDIEEINTELDNVVHKTGDEEISGEKTFTDDLTVHGEEQNSRGTIVLSPVTNGAIIQMKDVMNRPISIVHSHDSDDNTYLRVYPDNYYPVDEDENPVAPSNPTIMTSGLIAVDPRIVHTTGNETVAGNKNFIGTVKALDFQMCRSSGIIAVNGWCKYYEYDPSMNSLNWVVIKPYNANYIFTFMDTMIALRQGTSTVDGRIYRSDKIDMKLAIRSSDGIAEIWVKNLTSSVLTLRLEIEQYGGMGNIQAVNGSGNEPVVGDVYSSVTSFTVVS